MMGAPQDVTRAEARGWNPYLTWIGDDARKWLIGKMAPKKYGDKQQIEHASPDGGPVTLETLIMARLKKE
jgi:hypothetical protein